MKRDELEKLMDAYAARIASRQRRPLGDDEQKALLLDEQVLAALRELAPAAEIFDGPLGVFFKQQPTADRAEKPEREGFDMSAVVDDIAATYFKRQAAPQAPPTADTVATWAAHWEGMGATVSQKAHAATVTLPTGSKLRLAQDGITCLNKAATTDAKAIEAAILHAKKFWGGAFEIVNPTPEMLAMTREIATKHGVAFLNYSEAATKLHGPARPFHHRRAADAPRVA